MAVEDGRRGRLDILTHRSIWAIMPISAMFEAYWTATFFRDIIENGPQHLAGLAEEYMHEGQPYYVPPSVAHSYLGSVALPSPRLNGGYIMLTVS